MRLEFTNDVIPGGWLQVNIGAYMVGQGYRVSFSYKQNRVKGGYRVIVGIGFPW